MSITVGTELDPSLSDIELVEEWNQFFDQYGMRFPEFEESWFKENPLPEEMKNESDDDGSVKIELPEIFKKRDSLRSNLG